MSGILTHEQLLQAVGHVAEAALPRWGLGGATLKMINHSENTTYLATPANGARPVILRVHRDGYHSVNGIKSELNFDAAEAEGSAPELMASELIASKT
jgi:Ser/Thr protein kinase RdoA (MazF antagonist)